MGNIWNEMQSPHVVLWFQFDYNQQCSEGTLSYIQTRCEQALQNLDFDNDNDADDEKENANPRLKSTRIEDISLTEDVHTEVGRFIVHFHAQ